MTELEDPSPSKSQGMVFRRGPEGKVIFIEYSAMSGTLNGSSPEKETLLFSFYRREKVWGGYTIYPNSKSRDLNSSPIVPQPKSLLPKLSQ